MRQKKKMFLFLRNIIVAILSWSLGFGSFAIFFQFLIFISPIFVLLVMMKEPTWDVGSFIITLADVSNLKDTA